MQASNTISVSELIQILELYNPDELISFHNQYTIINRPWDRLTMFAGTYSVISANYEMGKVKTITPAINCEVLNGENNE